MGAALDLHTPAALQASLARGPATSSDALADLKANWPVAGPTFAAHFRCRPSEVSSEPVPDGYKIQFNHHMAPPLAAVVVKTTAAGHSLTKVPPTSPGGPPTPADGPAAFHVAAALDALSTDVNFAELCVSQPTNNPLKAIADHGYHDVATMASKIGPHTDEDILAVKDHPNAAILTATAMANLRTPGGVHRLQPLFDPPQFAQIMRSIDFAGAADLADPTSVSKATLGFDLAHPPAPTRTTSSTPTFVPVTVPSALFGVAMKDVQVDRQWELHGPVRSTAVDATFAYAQKPPPGTTVMVVGTDLHEVAVATAPHSAAEIISLPHPPLPQRVVAMPANVTASGAKYTVLKDIVSGEPFIADNGPLCGKLAPATFADQAHVLSCVQTAGRGKWVANDAHQITFIQ